MFKLFRKKEDSITEAAGGDMYLIAGLGNPGKKYEHTRHNAGYDALDVIIEDNKIPQSGKKFNALYGKGMIGSNRVLALKPLTYMNNSGESISEAAGYFKIDSNDHIIVIVDDINLEPGMIRIRTKGSAGGHNGLKSIINHLHGEDFIRIRIGVGQKPEGADQVKYVLGHLSSPERKKIEEAFEHVSEAVSLIVEGRVEEAMNRFNRKASN